MARQDPLPSVHPTDALVGHAPAVGALRAQIRHLATFDTVGNPSVPTLLLVGETGTGKGLLARVIHDSGPRAHGPFIAVNCAAIPETLLEAELFGFAAGAFTDARRAKAGLFEAAAGGTLLLDEIDALPVVLQPKLLTAIEEKHVRRLGAVVAHPVDVKLMAATKEDLGSLVAVGRFRVDLYHRLAVVLLELPPLRTRGEDSVLLAQHFLQRYAAAHGLPPKQLSARAEAWLQHYAWPGNVRELSHLMERVMLLHPEVVVEASTLERLVLRQPPAGAGLGAVSTEAESVLPDEAMRLRQALLQTGGNVARAARLVGLNRNTVRYRMRRYGIARPDGEAMLPPASLPLPARSFSVQEEGTDAGMLAPAWEQKPVAVLVITMTFPKEMSGKAVRYDAWTAAARWEQQLDEKIRGFGGVVIQRSPPLLMAVFGVPRTLEQMPQRAVQTALAIRHLAAEARAQARSEPVPEVRVAVHLGTVLVDVQAPARAAQIAAVGDTFTVPVQLLGHTRAGDVLLSPQVGSQVESLYQLEAHTVPLGPESSGMGAYTIIGPQPQPALDAAWRPRALSPFVGRERELATLHARLAQVEAGQGQVVGIVAEAGMGKSRLLTEFRQSLRGKRVTYLEGHCLSYGSATPYLPVRDLLRQHCSISDLDGPESITTKVSAVLQKVQMTPAGGAPYLLELLGVRESTERLVGLSPEALKRRTFETLRHLSLRGSQQCPLIIAVENLHWIDTTSEAYFASLIENLAGAAVLFLATYRPGYRPPWIDKSYATQFALQPLSVDDSRSIVQSAVRAESLSDTLVQRVIAKAEGNPFFLEELVRTVVEHSDAASDPTVPDTIQGALMARIDRLPDALKRFLQTAAVLGRAIPLQVLEALWEGPGHPTGHVERLKQLEFLYEQAEDAGSVYRFKHVLMQEVVYGSLPLAYRQTLHATAGQVIETLYADRLEVAAERLAYHYARSRQAAKAVEYLTHVAAKAVRIYAHVEAATLFQEALTHAAHLPGADRERRLLELSLLLALSFCFLGRFQDMLDLLLPQSEQVERLQDSTLAGPYYFRLGLTCVCLGEYERGIQHGQRAVAEAQGCGDTLTLGEAYYVLCHANFTLGRYAQAVTYGQQAVALLEPTAERHWLAVAQYVLALSYGSLGEFTPALEIAAHFEALGAASDDPQLQSHAALALGSIAVMQGEGEASLAACQRALACAPAGFIATLIVTIMGHAYLEQADAAQAIPVLEQVVQRYRQFRFKQGEGRAAATLSEAYLLHGDLAQAQAMAQQALDVSRGVHYGWGIGLAHRALGRIAQASGALEEAEHHLQEALQTFAAMQARFEVGRTHLALAALAHVRGNRDAVAACLMEAQNLFTVLQVPQYIARTTNLAEGFGASSAIETA